MLLVDTNILVDAADELSKFHSVSAAFMERRRASPDAWFTTWPILYEYLRVTTHPRVMKKPRTASQAWAFIVELLECPAFAVLTSTARHAEVAALVLAETPQLAGNIFHDAHTAILMRENGIKTIVTRDIDFHRFRFLEVIDPADA